jgi:hypothetical protein
MSSRRIRILLCLGVLLLAISTANGQHVAKLSAQNHKTEIEKLVALSTDTAKKQASSNVDTRAIAIKCADELERVQSYSSVALILDRQSKELASHDSLGLKMVFDYERPDRYHMVRNSWGGGPGYDFDEWVTIGDSEYTFTPIWMGESHSKLLVRTAGPDPREANREFGVQKYIEVLRAETPSLEGTYEYGDKKYHLLVYVLPANRYKGFPQTFVLHDSASGLLLLWIDSQTSLLAKSRFTAVADVQNSQPVSREYQQVFVGYSQEISVKPPSEICSKNDPSMCFALVALPAVPANAPAAASAPANPAVTPR